MEKQQVHNMHMKHVINPILLEDGGSVSQRVAGYNNNNNI